LHVRPLIVGLLVAAATAALTSHVVLDRRGGAGPGAPAQLVPVAATAAPSGPGARSSSPGLDATSTSRAASATTLAGPATTAGASGSVLAAVPADDPGWVRLPNGLRTRCADEPGVRLYLVDGDIEPVGLLDDGCLPVATR
jgi:hypothetical protein